MTIFSCFLVLILYSNSHYSWSCLLSSGSAQKSFRWLDILISCLRFFSNLYIHFLSNYHWTGGGSLQLLSGWSVDGGYLDTRHTCWSVYLGWSVCRFQRKAKCFWNWPGTAELIYTFAIFSGSSCSYAIAFSFSFGFQKYIEMAASLEGLSPNVPLYKVSEGNEPCFFTTYFSWDYAKAIVCEEDISVFNHGISSLLTFLYKLFSLSMIKADIVLAKSAWSWNRTQYMTIWMKWLEISRSRIK